ncbi:MAG: hypothetical protein ABF449_13570 [Ethanoligenens sp.]
MKIKAAVFSFKEENSEGVIIASFFTTVALGQLAYYEAHHRDTESSFDVIPIFRSEAGKPGGTHRAFLKKLSRLFHLKTALFLVVFPLVGITRKST